MLTQFQLYAVLLAITDEDINFVFSELLDCKKFNDSNIEDYLREYVSHTTIERVLSAINNLDNDSFERRASWYDTLHKVHQDLTECHHGYEFEQAGKNDCPACLVDHLNDMDADNWRKE